MSRKLPQLISSRGNYRGQVNGIYREIGSFSSKTNPEREAIASKLKRLQTELNALDPTIRDLKWEKSENENEADNINDEEISESGVYEDKISECLIAISNLNASPVAIPANHSSPLQTRLKSATVPLPTFSSNEGEDLTRFFHQFEDTTQRFNYSDYDKYLLLKQQVSGRASALINSLDSVQHSYTQAKKLLEEALASPAIRKFNVIKKMSNLKLEYVDEPFEYISKVNAIDSAFSALSISAEDILQYFAWDGLNENFKGQLVQITNVTKPSLSQIKDKFFEASERYLITQKRYKDRKKERLPVKATQSLAVNLDFDKSGEYNVFKTCSLCEMDSSHPVYRCSKYSDARSKVNRLNSLKACVRCARLDHKEESCDFHFRTRCNCGAWHFKFLCLGDKGSTKPEMKKDPKPKKPPQYKDSQHKETNSGSNCVESFCDTFNAMDCSQVALPTFSFTLPNGRKIRCLRDGGCQSNFIMDERAKLEGLPIVKSNVKLRVNGFNSSKVYNTQVYEVTMKIGEETHKVQAMGVPFINMTMKLPGLSKVVERFKDKGYQLADEFLLSNEENITNIEFVLGSNCAYCLMENLVSYGGNNGTPPSVFSSTPAGVMLVGKVRDMGLNSKFLPTFEIEIKVKTLTDASDCEEIPVVSLDDLGLYNHSSLQCYSEQEDMIETLGKFAVLNDRGEIVESELQKATNDALEIRCSDALGYDKETYQEDSVEINNKAINHVLRNTTRNKEGHLVMPLVWNNKVDHLLGRNQNLAKAILNSNFKKLSRKNGEYMRMVDQVFKEQKDLGIIEKIENLDSFLEQNPNHSFLAHMAVFKPERDTTKTRVVFLSNICEKNLNQAVTLSHNQTMLSGPSLNQKLSTTLLHLRFDSKLLCFDIKKAFLNICLSSQDSKKLLFLWYRNVERGDFSIVGYRCLRLPFGLVCSPFLLLLGLYKILILDTENDSQETRDLKRNLYSLIYMDNGSICANDGQRLRWAYSQLRDIFEPYKFFLQQFVTNDLDLQVDIDKNLPEATPSEVKLFGLNWNRLEDTLSTRTLILNCQANTKRLILQTIAAHFDLYGFTGPILNRARLFLHSLQCDKSLGWDTNLSHELVREWINICRQANSSPPIKIPRFIGKRDESYRLIACTDSSKEIYGTVVYIQNVKSNDIHFVIAKNRIVNKQLSSKSIPTLELQAITLGVEVLIDLYQEMSGSSCINPIKITDLLLFSDSMVSLAWINSYSGELGKMNKHSVFVRNRMESISRLCQIHPVTFKFISGIENPADQISRAVSHKVLMKSNFLSGPNLENSSNKYSSKEDLISVTIPNPVAKSGEVSLDEDRAVFTAAIGEEQEYSVLSGVYSSFSKVVSVYSRVLQFIHSLKSRLFNKDKVRYNHLRCPAENLRTRAITDIIGKDQRIHYPEIFSYLDGKNKNAKDMPSLISQLNIYLDKQGLLRIKSKCSRWKDDEFVRFPILLHKSSPLTRLIILDMHENLSHAGCYRLLSDLRKQFYICHYFSVVKGVLKSCVTCRKTRQRTVKLNQSPYRDFRLDPPNVPFQNIFIDHLGHYFIKHNGTKIKVWLLCITCLWTRAINLKICIDLSTKEFLRAFQLHCFEYGVPQLCLSDLGTSLVAGANVMTDFLKDPDTATYLEEKGVQIPTFSQYFKGYHPLGGLVEVCVKLVRELLRCSIKKYVLEYREFEFIVSQTIHLVNRRPIAFQEGLRDKADEVVPDPITPEKLIHGFDLTSLNLIPELQPDPEYDPEWMAGSDSVDMAKRTYNKLKKVRTLLTETYHSEFLGHLMKQATNEKSRYRPVTHQRLQIGDIVLLKEENCKPINYPMARVKEVKVNVNNEVTDAILIKGKNRELVKRHVTSIIPILSSNEISTDSDQISPNSMVQSSEESDNRPGHHTGAIQKKVRPKRKAAFQSRKKTKQMLVQ